VGVAPERDSARGEGRVPAPRSLTLVIGNKNYSSWSMRPWVLMRDRGIEFSEIQIPLRREDSDARKLTFSPAGKVPVLIDGDARIWESLAILEYLAELEPDRGLWPQDAAARAMARSVSSEMHAGFETLRTHMPMNCRARYPGAGRGPGVEEEIERVRGLWRDCRERFGSDGEFLFGSFTIADAMFAPVVSRFQTYGVDLAGVEADYSRAVLSLPAVSEWMEAAAGEPWTIEMYEVG
jgi:glutathione S-transferase